MKGLQKAGILAAALIFVACPVAGHAQDASDAATDSASAKNIQMVAARAALDKTIDTKKIKQGDAVTAKLQEDVKVPDSMELPKNTELLGHVDQVQPSENRGDSSIQVTFDKAQLKNGQQLAIKATIMQIALPANAMMNQAESSAASPSMASSSPAPSSSGGGGGGMQSSQPRLAASMPSSGIQEPSQQSAQQGGVPGVQLQSDIHQSNSGTFTAKKRNVHLDGGTQLQMAVAVIPANTQVK